MSYRFIALSQFMWIFLAPTVYPQSFTSLLRQLESSPVDSRRILADEWLKRHPSTAFPITEDSLAHFVFIGDSVRSVRVAGDFNLWNPEADSMRHVEGTDWFVLTRAFEPDARLDYKYVVDSRNWTLDPRNPRTCRGGFGSNSELAMPGYVQPEEIVYNPDIPHGTLDTLSFQSAIFDNDRNVYVYRPPGYRNRSSDRYPSLYVNDGGEYLTLGFMRNVLDNLIHAGKIQGTVVVFVEPVDRKREYWLNGDYQRILVSELVPRIDSCYRTVRKSPRRGILGASLGGLAAVDAVFSHPDVFGLCASQSGAFWVDGEAIVPRVQCACVKNVRFYFDWGTYEPSIPDIHHRMRDILLSKKCEVRTLEFHEGHSWGSWRAHLEEALIFLYPK
jgi:enterochelin esterase-like enzyme